VSGSGARDRVGSSIGRGLAGAGRATGALGVAPRLLAAVSVAVACAAALAAPGARALVTPATVGAPVGVGECASCSPWWHLISLARPSNLHAGGGSGAGEQDGEIVVIAANVGDASASAGRGPIRLSDILPAGLEPVSISAQLSLRALAAGIAPRCPSAEEVRAGAPLTCVLEGTYEDRGGETVPEYVAPFNQIEMRIGVRVTGAHTGERNQASVSGGGAPQAVAQHAITISESPAGFGVEAYELAGEAAGGGLDTQAGSHPFQQTTTLAFETSSVTSAGSVLVAAPPRDLSVRWPAGMIGDPAAAERCPTLQFEHGGCAAGSIVGVAANVVDLSLLGVVQVSVPIYEVEPLPGEIARFAFAAEGLPGVPAEGTSVFIGATVRSGEDYGVSAHIEDIPATIPLLSSELTIWGVPGAAAHDGQRGVGCLDEADGESPDEVREEGFAACTPLEQSERPPLLTLPTACAGPLQSAVLGDSWSAPQRGEGATLAGFTTPALNGCNRVPFAPALQVTPDVAQASSPAGFALDVHVPQSQDLNGEGLSASAVRDISIALPAGVSVDPAAGNGQQACPEALAGYLPGGSEPPAQLRFTPYMPGGAAALAAGSEEALQPGVNFCADASKIGTVTISTPLLAHALTGGVYLASQDENPFGSLLALYILAEEPQSGVTVKLAGQVKLSETGQVTASIEDLPQLPFEDVTLQFFGGERALLATPANCGPYTSTATLTPWAGGEAVTASSAFAIASGPGAGPGEAGNGSGCPGATLPFAPTLTAGSEDENAGAFSPLTVTLGRSDGQQDLRAVTLRLPPGLSALLAGVPPCPEAQAGAGTCPASSQIGETTASAGLGSDPVTVSGGRVYLTGPTPVPGSPPGGADAPFGLAIVTPVKAGPLDLEDAPESHPACDCLVIRASVQVDPGTAALTIATQPIPRMLDGIPLDIQHLNITIGEPGAGGGSGGRFILNPTDCQPLQIAATIAGAEGASAQVSSPFQLANCASLRFEPKLQALTYGNGEFRGHGASLHIELTTPPGPAGPAGAAGAAGEANVRALKVDLPERLPARLETIQQACPEQTFGADPAACPPAAAIGTATVATPILGVPLTGPVYLVAKPPASGARANGGENPQAAFPELVLALQGGGVTIELTGELYVSEANITSVTFRALPDVPIARLDLVLPEGPRSALAASSSLCTKRPLTMLAAITGQNGARVKAKVTVGVAGCPRERGRRGREGRRGRRGRHGRRKRRS